MWARVSRYQFPEAEVERVIEQFNEAVDAFSGQPGLKRTDVLVNRRSGAGITVSVWESEESMNASAEAADRLRSDIALELLGWIEGVDQYELVRSEAYQ